MFVIITLTAYGVSVSRHDLSRVHGYIYKVIEISRGTARVFEVLLGPSSKTFLPFSFFSLTKVLLTVYR